MAITTVGADNMTTSVSNRAPRTISYSGDSPNIDITEHSKKFITQFPGDSPNGGFSSVGSAADKLPKSLFYQYTEGEVGASSGLFNYYLLGRSSGETGLKYKGSENYGSNNIITPEESRNPSAALIIKETTIGGSYLDPNSPYVGQPYDPKDFIFCKDYSKIPNNRMITLRRFPTPVFDNLKVPLSASYPVMREGKMAEQGFSGFDKKDLAKNQVNVPLCQAVGYFGEGTGNDLNQLIGIESGLNWTPRDQEKIKDYTKNDPGFYNGFSDVFKSLFNEDINEIAAGVNRVGGTFFEPDNIEKSTARKMYDILRADGGPLSQKLFVDINTVNRMYVRDVGITSNDSPFNVTFKYDLTSASDINSKLLFLDLLTNLLALGTDYGKFLTPQILENPITRGFSFPGGAEGYKKYLLDPVDWIANLIRNNHSAAASAKTKELEKTMAELKAEFQQFAKSGNITKEGKLYKSLTLLLTENMLNHLVFEPLMLSGYPTGDWHLVIGNPLNPIAMIGNLICHKVKITFDSELGPDDFPTGMTAVYELRHARTRHRGEYESMFNRGNGRLYLGEFPETSPTQGNITISGKDPDQIKDINLKNTISDYNATTDFSEQNINN